MGLVVAGPPKAGTSALRSMVEQMGLKRLPGSVVWDEYRWLPRAVEPRGVPADVAWDRLGRGQFVHAHVPPGPWMSRHRALVVLRDPRANVVSWWRAKWHANNDSERGRGTWSADPTPAQLVAFRRWVAKGKRGGLIRAVTYVKPIHDAWLAERRPHCLVWYERLRERETLERVAEYVGGSVPDPAAFYGRSSKWTGRPTVWEEWFDDETEERFWTVWRLTKHAEPIRG